MTLRPDVENLPLMRTIALRASLFAALFVALVAFAGPASAATAPTLTVSGLSAPSSVTEGMTLPVSYQVSRTGDGFQEGALSFYLSADAAAKPADSIKLTG